MCRGRGLGCVWWGFGCWVFLGELGAFRCLVVPGELGGSLFLVAMLLLSFLEAARLLGFCAGRRVGVGLLGFSRDVAGGWAGGWGGVVFIAFCFKMIVLGRPVHIVGWRVVFPRVFPGRSGGGGIVYPPTNTAMSSVVLGSFAL